jgi:hypothetical protein
MGFDPGMVGASVPQKPLDDLAAAWSDLDRSRPRDTAEIGRAIAVVHAWVTAALAVDSLLVSALSGAYAVARAEEPGGPALLALRWVWGLVDAGHQLGNTLVASPGMERLFWELYWPPPDRLPDGLLPVDGLDDYSLYLASQPVRTPAALTTSFLLSLAVHLRMRAADA